MMKRIVFVLLLAAVFFLTGCPVPLGTNLPADLVLMLGLFNPAGGVVTLRAALGGTIDIPVLITDQTGGTAAGNYDVAFTLSADADLATTGDNIAAGTASIAAGAESVASVAVPATAVAATYTLFGAMTATDAAANNNVSSVTLDVGAVNLPDLVIDLGSTPSWADPGTTITVSYSITNDGFAKVASGTAFKVQFTVNLSAVDEVMGEDIITLGEDLNPQALVTRQLAISLPSVAQMATDDGVTTTELDDFDVDFTVTTDVDDDVTEIAEGSLDFFTVVSGNRKPDFVLNDIIRPDTFVAAKAGNPVQLTIEIRNDGAAASAEYGVDLYVDILANGTYDAGTDVLLHQWAEADTPSVPYDLSGNGNNIVYLNPPVDVLYPAGITPGTYDIMAEIVTVADEWATGNNDETEPNVDFVDNIFNLFMRFMSSDLSDGIDEATGGTIPLSYILENDGVDAVTASFDVEFYASDDNNLTPAGDILLGTDTVTADVPGNGALAQSFDATMPAASGAAFYTVYWVIDSTSAVDEFEEGDNQPGQPEECYVFPLVSDGVAVVDTRLLAYKPWGADTQWRYVEAFLYDTPWSSWDSDFGGASTPGDLYGWVSHTLTPGSTGGIRMYNTWGYNDLPVAFRLVPNYVNDLPPSMIPTKLSGQDSYESNDTTGTAKELSGSTNPLYGFVTIWLDWSSGDMDDYFTFDIP